jgi:ABC-2 type transport system permease protein
VNPRRVAAIARRILEGFRRDRRTVALVFGVPIVILSLFWYLMRGGGAHPGVGVVNLDSGPLGQQVTQRLLDSDDVAASTMSESEARDRLADGRIAGYILFPTDFSARASQQRDVAPEVRLEGTQPSLNGAVLNALSKAMSEAVSGAGPRLDVRVSYLHGGSGLDTLDYFGAAFIGLVVFFIVYVITSIAFLRERSQGTLERLMATPLRRAEIVVGYMVGFGAVALLQALIVLVYALYVIRIQNAGSVWLLFVFDALLAIGAVNLGIFFSTFARNEFQAVQFIPLVIVPQVLLSGIVFPVNTEPGLLQPVSNILPLTYAVYGMRDVMLKGAGLASPGVVLDLGVGALFAAVAIALGALTLRRRAA